MEEEDSTGTGTGTVRPISVRRCIFCESKAAHRIDAPAVSTYWWICDGDDCAEASDQKYDELEKESESK